LVVGGREPRRSDVAVKVERGVPARRDDGKK
jgi:hypothetical protein